MSDMFIVQHILTAYKTNQIEAITAQFPTLSLLLLDPIALLSLVSNEDASTLEEKVKQCFGNHDVSENLKGVADRKGKRRGRKAIAMSIDVNQFF